MASALDSRRSWDAKSPPSGDRDKAQILTAIAELVAERGYEGTSRESIIERAKVPRRVFDENFAGKEECFVAAFDANVEAAARILGEVPDEHLAWPDRLAGAIELLIGLISAEPARAHLCLVAAPTAGPRTIAHYRAALERVAVSLREGRHGIGGKSTPDCLEAVLVGGFAWLLEQRLVGSDPDPHELLPEMVQTVFVRYGGVRAQS